MRGAFYSRQHQHGSVLLISLIILVMVSLLGLAAMRASIFSNKVTTGIQADTMSFEAAESAIGLTFRTLSEMSEIDLTAAVVDGSSIAYCITESGVTAGAGCSDFMDSRSLLRASSFASQPLNNCRPIPGFDVEDFKDLVINMLGESEMPSYNIENHHLQEGLKLGRNCL